MDIHAPHEPVRGWKELAVHIAAVTVGILIALALEGLREVVRDHRLVAETRTNFRRELAVDRDHAAHELPAIQAISRTLDQLAAQAGTPGQSDAIAQTLHTHRNPGYFFALSSWQTALSTGALQHMEPDEVEQYAGASETIRVYTGLQAEALRVENEANAFYDAHPQPSPAEEREGAWRLLLLARAEHTLVHVGAQLDAQLRSASEAAAP